MEKDYAQLQLSLFQVEELISHYEKLINLQEELQSKHYQAIKHMEDINLIEDYVHQGKLEQNTTIEDISKAANIWQEAEQHQISKILQDIEDGTAAKTLAEEEKEFI